MSKDKCDSADVSVSQHASADDDRFRMAAHWVADVLLRLEMAAQCWTDAVFVSKDRWDTDEIVLDNAVHCWTDAVFVSKDRWDRDEIVVDNAVHCWTDAVFVSKDRWDSADVSVSQHASADADSA